MFDFEANRESVEELPYDGKPVKFSAPTASEQPEIPLADGPLPIQGLTPEWVVVLPGLLFSHGGFVANPLREWYARNEKHRPLRQLPMREPVYQGGGQFGDYAVACRADAWPSLGKFLSGVKAVSPDGKQASQAFLHRVILRPAKTPPGWSSAWRAAVQTKTIPPRPTPPVPVVPWVVGVTADHKTWYVEGGRPPVVALDTDGRQERQR